MRNDLILTMAEEIKRGLELGVDVTDNIAVLGDLLDEEGYAEEAERLRSGDRSKILKTVKSFFYKVKKGVNLPPHMLCKDRKKAEADTIDIVKKMSGLDPYIETNFGDVPGKRVIAIMKDCSGDPAELERLNRKFGPDAGYETYEQDLYEVVLQDDPEFFGAAFVPLEPTLENRMGHMFTSPNLYETSWEDSNRLSSDEVEDLDADRFQNAINDEDDVVAQFILACFNPDWQPSQDRNVTMETFKALAQQLGKV